MSILKSTVAAAALAVAFAAPAVAIPIPTASFDLVGALTGSGGATFDQSTAFDFGQGPTFTTFGTAGGTVELSGGINPVFTAEGFIAGLQGTVQDLASVSLGTKNITNFYRFTSGTNVLAFNLGAITQINRIPGGGSVSPTINVFGTGTLNLTGYDPTPGLFSLATSNTGAGLTATFQSSVNSTGVPEPATLALLGMGLAGLAAVRRRA